MLDAFKLAKPCASVVIGGGETMDTTKRDKERGGTTEEKPLIVVDKAAKATINANTSMMTSVVVNLYLFLLEPFRFLSCPPRQTNENATIFVEVRKYLKYKKRIRSRRVCK